MLFPVFLDKSYILEKFSAWDIGQNALVQSDCMNVKSTMSLKQKDEKAWFFACLYKFMEIKSGLKNIGVGVVKKGCVHSCHRTLGCISRRN